MSSQLTTLVPILTGANWKEWNVSMWAYLRSQGQWYIMEQKCPGNKEDTQASWDDHNEKAMGNIILRLAPPLCIQVTECDSAKSIWDNLDMAFGKPSIGTAFTEFKALLETTIPASTHPALALTKIQAHFTYLKEAGFELSKPVQTMMVMAKLPPSMEVVAQILNQTPLDKISDLTLDKLIHAATLSFEQCGGNHCWNQGRSGGHQANKLSAVKHKQADPKFTQQQQQQGSFGGGLSRNAPTGGKHQIQRGGKKARA